MDFDREAAAVLAHEVKNPLSLIRANMDLIKDRFKGSKEEKYVELIYREIDRINAVVSDYAAKRDERSIVFLEDLLCDVIDEYHVTDNKRVEFIIEAAGGDICVSASYSKLCILFFNILKNAVEAVEDKGSILTRIERSGDYAVISVTDNGKGIDESIAAVAGRPYVSDKENGMGLGLVICKKIAAEYGGGIGLENMPEGDCRVTVTLKAYTESA